MMRMVVLAGQLFLSKQSLLCLDGRERETHTTAPCTHESNTGTRTHATHADIENQPTRRGDQHRQNSRQGRAQTRIAHPYPLRSYHHRPHQVQTSATSLAGTDRLHIYSAASLADQLKYLHLHWPPLSPHVPRWTLNRSSNSSPTRRNASPHYIRSSAIHPTGCKMRSLLYTRLCMQR